MEEVTEGEVSMVVSTNNTKVSNIIMREASMAVNQVTAGNTVVIKVGTKGTMREGITREVEDMAASTEGNTVMEEVNTEVNMVVMVDTIRTNFRTLFLF